MTLRNAIASALLGGLSACATGRVPHSNAYYDQQYLSAPYNWAFRSRFPTVDALFNAFDYGHAKLYETLWRDPNVSPDRLDQREFRFITRSLLRNPPPVPLDESAIAPDWEKLAPEIAMMFDWAHILHRQIYDVWADDRIPVDQKDAQVARLVRYYKSRPALAFSSSPKNMNLMEGQSYSLSFRKRFPTYNGLIWSYHWLQMTLYEALLSSSDPALRRENLDAVVARFWQMIDSAPASLPRSMPLAPAIAPMFSTRYPEAAIIFDNLHSLHDVVSDILADPAIPRTQKRAWLLDAAARYRDDASSVVSVEDWKAMANAMGLDNMGGPAPVKPPDDH
ncbi:MAG TPA: hypothetical protein VGG76_04700 [Gemmatimonadaceae bacterium]|jgi:hypothetical protein